MTMVVNKHKDWKRSMWAVRLGRVALFAVSALAAIAVQNALNQRVCQHGRVSVYDNGEGDEEVQCNYDSDEVDDFGNIVHVGCHGGVHLHYGDALQTFLDPLNELIHEHEDHFDYLIIFHALAYDVLTIHFAWFAILHSSTARPIAAMATALALRSVCQVLVQFPCPPGFYWRHPGFPSISIDYHPAQDFFFSGHTVTLLVAMMEYRRAKLSLASTLVAVFLPLIILLVLVTRTHYTVDVIMAFAAAPLAHAAGNAWESWWEDDEEGDSKKEE